MKKVFVMVLILLYQHSIMAHCPKKWEKGSAMGSDYFDAVPLNNEIAAGSGAVLNFQLRFEDTDKAKAVASSSTCPIGSLGAIECPNAKYRIRFKISNANLASFNLTSSDDIKIVDAQIFALNYRFSSSSSKRGTLWTSIAVPVYIKPTFVTGTNIIITAEIMDETDLPAGDIGDPKDTPKIHKWTIRYNSGRCPDSLSLRSPLPNDSWQDGTREGLVAYTYKCLPNLPSRDPDYQGLLISEFLDTLISANFDLSDIDRTFLASNPSLVTANAVAKFLFLRFAGVNATFEVDTDDTFEDVHGIIPVDGAVLDLLVGIFGSSGIIANKCGFSMNQTYKCNGNVIGRAVISKRVSYYPADRLVHPEVKKLH